MGSAQQARDPLWSFLRQVRSLCGPQSSGRNGGGHPLLRICRRTPEHCPRPLGLARCSARGGCSPGRHSRANRPVLAPSGAAPFVAARPAVIVWSGSSLPPEVTRPQRGCVTPRPGGRTYVAETTPSGGGDGYPRTASRPDADWGAVPRESPGTVSDRSVAGTALRRFSGSRAPVETENRESRKGRPVVGRNGQRWPIMILC
jgi:hypothetical protein